MPNIRPSAPHAGNAIVSAAVSTLRAFSDEMDRSDAAVLLSMWPRRRELSPADRLEVLDAFGPPPVQPAHAGCKVGSRWAQ
jgi:hypothetical protein